LLTGGSDRHHGRFHCNALTRPATKADARGWNLKGYYYYYTITTISISSAFVAL
jgi:hypothetical protein